MSAIVLKVIDDAEAWLRENMPNVSSDNICSVYPLAEFNPNGITRYRDNDQEIEKDCTVADHVHALQQLCDKVGRTLFVGGIKNPVELVDTCNWDAEVTDAYWQLVMLGDVVYG